MLKKLFDFFLYSSLFMAVCAIVMILQTNRLFGLQYDTKSLFGFVFSATICSYNLHWYLTPASPPGTYRIQWTDKSRKLLLFLFLAGLVASSIFFIPLRSNWMAISIAILATFLYTAPKIPFPRFQLLKKIAIGKTIFLSFVWMYVTAMLPILISGKSWSPLYSVYCIGRFFLVYAICILFDMRDRDEDKKQGIRSLITVLTERQVFYLFLVSLLIYFASSLSMFWFGYSIGIVIAFVIPGILTASLWNYARRSNSDIFYYFVLDGLMMLSSLLCLFIPI